MEKYNDIENELIEMSNGDIKRVRSILAPILTVVGITLGVLFYFYGQLLAFQFGYMFSPILIYVVSGALIIISLLYLWVSSHYYLYTPSNEKIMSWSRYFDNSEANLLKTYFDDNEFDKISNLLYAKDKNGDDGTSAILIELKGTKSGKIAFAQIVQYIKHSPTPVSPVKMFTGDAAKKIVKISEQINQ